MTNLSDPSMTTMDIYTEMVQAKLNAELGEPDSCERPTGHEGACGWFISAHENETAILNGRCGAEPVVYRGVIRA